MTKICLILLLIKSTLIGFTLGACKVHDAKWINIMPIVTQPSRTHPEKGLYLVPILPSKKYSDMLNMKALVGIRIIFMGKEFE